MNLSEHVALVTGAGSGIGRATALAFARHGARVVAADANAATAEQTARAVHDAGGEAFGVRADVTQEDEVRSMVDRAVATYGRLDMCFNNAGVEQPRATVTALSDTDWRRTLDVNLRSMWLCLKHELPALAATGGAVVNCSSIAGVVGARGAPAYVASKHGIVGLTRAAALEHAAAGVRVNAVCPGYIRTPMNDRVIAREPETERRYVTLTPMGRMGTADEVAEAVVWLCSPAASFVTGVALSVDGGLAAQ